MKIYLEQNDHFAVNDYFVESLVDQMGQGMRAIDLSYGFT